MDRVFTIAGAGTVVTGTMWSGATHRDDRVELMPSGVEARVRTVQVHSETVDEAVAGQRVAMNLAGVEKDDIGRGDVVSAPGTLTVTDRFDATFTYLGSEEKPFETDTRVHVHHGTREVVGRVLLMGAERLLPGETAFAQVRLDEPLSPRYGDRFIVRSYSPMWTIGGGAVLDALPPRRTTRSEEELALLEALRVGDVPAAAVGLLVSRHAPMTSAEVAAALGVERKDVADALNTADLARLKVGGETRFVREDVLEHLVGAVDDRLREFHDAQPKATGMSTKALRDQVDPRLSGPVFDAVLELAVERGVAEVHGGEVRHPEAAVAAVAAEDEARHALSRLLDEQGLAPASLQQLADDAGVDRAVAAKALTALVADGEVVRLGPDLHFSAGAVEDARARIVAYLREHGTMLAKEARDATGTSRKYIVPLLEYFDAQGVTKRDGDVRTLR